MKTIREYIDLIENAQNPVDEGKNNIDNKIIHLMTNGIPADEIARKLDIPVEWVHEVAKYNMPDSAIDYNDPRNSTQGRERFGEQGVAEGQATRTCPQCDGSGEDTLDPTKSCRRCGGKGHIPMSPREQGVAEDEATAQKYAVRMNAQQLGSTNRTKYTWTGTASSDDQAREMAIAYADRHGFKNIVVKEISKKEQAVDEQATPEAVAKINSLFSR